jgi:DNA-binding Lrp family transcriptional regulator
VAALAEELADVAGITEVYSVAGDVDLIAIVRVERHEALADVVTRHVAALEGIVETRTMVAFQAFSRHDLDALWDLGAG